MVSQLVGNASETVNSINQEMRERDLKLALEDEYYKRTAYEQFTRIKLSLKGVTLMPLRMNFLNWLNRDKLNREYYFSLPFLFHLVLSSNIDFVTAMCTILSFL